VLLVRGYKRWPSLHCDPTPIFTAAQSTLLVFTDQISSFQFAIGTLGPFRKVTKTAYKVRGVSRSVRLPPVRTFLRGLHFQTPVTILYRAHLWKPVEEHQISFQQGTSLGDVSTFYCCRRCKIAIKVLPSSPKVSGCQESRGDINTRRTGQNGTLYVPCPQCYSSSTCSLRR